MPIFPYFLFLFSSWPLWRSSQQQCHSLLHVTGHYSGKPTRADIIALNGRLFTVHVTVDSGIWWFKWWAKLLTEKLKRYFKDHQTWIIFLNHQNCQFLNIVHLLLRLTDCWRVQALKWLTFLCFHFSLAKYSIQQLALNPQVLVLVSLTRRCSYNRDVRYGFGSCRYQFRGWKYLYSLSIEQ